jgi:xylulokinase
MADLLLAHDIGTSADKATVFWPDGTLVASETTPYQTYYVGGTSVEQDPREWWRAVCDSTQKLFARVRADRIAVVSFSGQMMGCVCVDADGRTLRNALIYSDQRATAQCDALVQRLGADRIYRITGHRPSASYSIEKLMWLRDNEPDVYGNTETMLLAKDYIVLQLTGRRGTDYSDASGTNAFDLDGLRWSEEIIAAAGVERSMIPEAVPSTEVIGEVTAGAAEETGLAAGTPVVIGAGDGGCATIGAGSVAPPSPYNIIGSSSWISISSERPVFDPEMRTFNWAHPITGLYQPTGTMQTAGSSFKWLQEEICRIESTEARKQGRDPFELINEVAAQSAPGANGVLFLPYLMGERTPWWNPDARGVFSGIALNTSRADMIRAVIEGVAMNLSFTLECFPEAADATEMTVIGGGAVGEIWQQTLADVYGKEILTATYLEEATSLGAAIIGGVGAGLLSGFDVAPKMNPPTARVRPRTELTEKYRKRRELLAEHYKSLAPLFGELSRDRFRE